MNFAFLKSFFYYFDLFKFGFSFQFSKGQKQFSTPFGCLFSIAIFTILIISFVTSDMIMKTNPMTLSQSFPLVISPEIMLNKNNYNIMYGLFSKEFVSFELDPSYFHVNINGVTITNNNWNITKSFPSRLCNQSELSPGQTLYPLQIEYAYCFEEDFEYPIGGGYFGSTSTTLVLELLLCNSSLSNITCKTEQEVQSFLQGKYFAIYNKNSYIDFNNYKQPITLFPGLIYTPISSSTRTILQITLMKEQLFDDDSYILSNKKELEFFAREALSTTSVGRNFTDNTGVVECWISSSNGYKRNTRVYQKLPDVLGKLSGITNLCIFLGFMILNLYNHMILTLYFIRKVLSKSGKNDNSNNKVGVNEKIIELPKLILKDEHIDNKDNIKKEENSILPLQNRKNALFSKLDPKSGEEELSIQSERNYKENSPKKKINKQLKTFLNDEFFLSDIKDYVFFKVKNVFGCKLNDNQKRLFESEKQLEKMLNIKLVLRKIIKINDLHHFYDNYFSLIKHEKP